MMRRFARRALALAPLVLLVPAAASGAETLALTVDDAVRIAIRQGEAAEIARQDVRYAEAQKGIALALALPKVNFSAVYNRNLKKPVIFFPTDNGGTQSIELGEDNDYQATLSFDQTLYSFGRVGSGYHGAKEQFQAARLQAQAAAADIALQVRTAYYGAVLAAQQVDLAERSLDQADRRREEIAARVQNGVLPRFDLLRAEVEVANRRPVVTRSRNQAAIAEEELKRVAGLPLDQPIALTDTLAWVPFESDREVVEKEAIDSRPDLEAARHAAESARGYLTAQSRNDLPILSMNGYYQWQGQTSDGFVPDSNQTAETAAIGLTLSWPLYDGWDNRGRTRQARANASRAELGAESLERAVRVQARSAWADVRSIAEELVGTAESIRVAEEAYAIAEARYQNGLSTQLELVDSDLALYQARITRSETLYRYNVALATLEHAIGRGPELVPKDR